MKNQIIGTETEFGITCPTEPNHIRTSAWLVDAYAHAQDGGPVRWDYRGEDPLNDARGYRIERAAAHPSQLTDDPSKLAPSMETVGRPSDEQLALPTPSNTVLSNGGRFYVDHAHPEYSSPETRGPHQAVLFDKAGDLIAHDAAQLLADRHIDVHIYKNNTDNKGASYGSHENYLVDRSLNFDDLTALLIPFLITRPLVCGAGRLGFGQKSEEPGFQISQRADFIENDIGLETTFNRPIMNTRDEPHATSAYRRLHVIVGDANLFDYSNLLKFGTMSCVLELATHGASMEIDALALDDPVGDARGVSYRPFTHTLSLRNGEELTPIQLQRRYLDLCQRYLDQDPDTAEMLALWESVLHGLENDMASVADKVEWVGKYLLLKSLKDRDNLDWDAAKLRAVDVQWHDLHPEKSLVNKLRNAGRVAELYTDAEVRHAVNHPPTSTRAYLRGELIRRYRDRVHAAAWDSITVDTGADDLLRISTLEPDQGTFSDIGEYLDRGCDDLIAELGKK